MGALQNGKSSIVKKGCSAEVQALLERLAAMADDDIDTDDIPEAPPGTGRWPSVPASTARSCATLPCGSTLTRSNGSRNARRGGGISRRSTGCCAKWRGWGEIELLCARNCEFLIQLRRLFIKSSKTCFILLFSMSGSSTWRYSAPEKLSPRFRLSGGSSDSIRRASSVSMTIL